MSHFPPVDPVEQLNYRYQNFSRKIFFAEHLVNADFQHSDLTDTTFSRSDLRGARFRDPSADAGDKIAEAKGLTCNSFPGSDLKGALLPAYAENYPQLKSLEDGAKDGGKILFTVAAVSTFCLLTSGVFTDASLLTNGTLASALPALGLTLPVKPFVVVAPFFLLALHLYFLMALHHYEDILGTLPAVFPDGTLLKHRVYPWLFSSFPAVYRERHPKASDILNCSIAFVLAYLLPPLTIWIIWFRVLCLHNLVRYTTLLALFMAFLASVLQFASSRSRLISCSGLPPSGRARVPRWMAAILAGCTALFAIGFWITMHAGFGRIDAPTGYIPAGQSDPHLSVKEKVWKAIGSFEAVNVADADLSKKPANWSGGGSSDEQELRSIIGADLRWTNLRYLRGFRSFLAKAQLNSSDLTGAVLAYSDLRGADLRSARLVDADFNGANLRYAYLNNATLTRAKFDGADLSGADLRDSDVTVEQVSNAFRISYDTLLPSGISTTKCVNSHDVLVIRLYRSGAIEKRYGLSEPDKEHDQRAWAAWNTAFQDAPKCKDVL